MVRRDQGEPACVSMFLWYSTLCKMNGVKTHTYQLNLFNVPAPAKFKAMCDGRMSEANRSVIWGFCHDMQALITLLSSTNIQYVRCIKSSEQHKALKADTDVVLPQPRRVSSLAVSSNWWHRVSSR